MVVKKTSSQRRPLADINVTPMVDIMLVLLIIFMVSAPLMKATFKVDLPTGGKSDNAMKRNVVILAVDARKNLFLDDIPVKPARLKAELRKKDMTNKDKRIYIKADKSLAYGDIVRLMDRVHSLGYHLSLVSNPSKKRSSE